VERERGDTSRLTIYRADGSLYASATRKGTRVSLAEFSRGEEVFSIHH
jgi:hypothetical protein